VLTSNSEAISGNGLVKAITRKYLFIGIFQEIPVYACDKRNMKIVAIISFYKW
jgi:hypothetical protein